MRRVFFLAVLLFPAIASALTIEEVNGMIDAKKPPAEVVTAINASTDVWLPRHFYTLLDRKAAPDVLKAMAAKAAVFYDGTNLTSLDSQWAKQIGAVPKQTIEIKTPEDWAKFFDFYGAVKKESDAAKAKAGARPLAPNAGENDAAFDKRQRTWDEALVVAMGPVDGKIDQTTFKIVQKIKVTGFDGACYEPLTVPFDLSAYSFDVWRAGMGKAAANPMVAANPDKKSSIAVAQFVADGANHRFEVTTKKLCPYEYADDLPAHGTRLELEIKRTRKGDDWSVKGGVIDASTGEKVDAG